MTNNPSKVENLMELGIRVDDRVGLEAPVHPENAFYLATKVRRMRHMLNLEQPPDRREPA
jgi:3,4-dihydroxy 2-butanone 4-phosphate synthase/GTP cyclohydrolase II